MKRSIGGRAGAWLVAGVLGAAALYPAFSREWAAERQQKALAATERKLRMPHAAAPTPDLSLRVQRLNGLLASWETIGGCGAGTSSGSGGAIKWIGRGTSGGLFQLQMLGAYTHMSSGYILSFNSQVSRDLSEKWNFGASVPLLYKYYRDYYGRPVDVSNGGVGDVGVFLTRRFGEINNTAVTLLAGLPTGAYDSKYKNDTLTQEKQLGLGRLTGTLILDHTLDQLWGVIVLGGAAGYRGGENKLGNYRAPVASAYAYAGYFLGPWVPSLGLTYQRFFGADRDRGLEQEELLSSVAGTFGLEWSTDWVAVLGAVSLPYGFELGAKPASGAVNPLRPGFQPWTVALGLSFSPF